MKLEKRNVLLVISAAYALSSCSASDYESFSNASKSVLAQTGAVSANQADALLAFGGKINASAESITEEQEYYIGRAVAANVLGKYKALNNNSLNLYLTKIALNLASFSERPETFSGYRVAVLETDEINAVSAPGGFIFISKGFLKLVPNEEALAALIAHEVAHVVKGHGLDAIKEAGLAEGLVKLGSAMTPSEVSSISSQLTSAFGNSVDDIVTSLLVKGYSRSQEYDADELSSQLIQKAGYNPNGLRTVLESLNSHTKLDGGWNSTHPDTDDRIEELEESGANPVEGQQIRTARFLKEIAGL